MLLDFIIEKVNAIVKTIINIIIVNVIVIAVLLLLLSELFINL